MEIKARGLTFDVYEGGPADGTPVLLLHGFPQDHREFDPILPRLHAAGLRTYALDQRGYSPGARPAAVADYRLSEPTADAVAVLDALGVQRAHVIGHDWGAQVGWLLAARHPDRVRTLTAISVPHPRGLAVSLRNQPSQRLRFAYMAVFRSRFGERLLLARGGEVLKRMMRPIGARADLYASAMAEPGRLTGGLGVRDPADVGDASAVGEVAIDGQWQHAALAEAAVQLLELGPAGHQARCDTGRIVDGVVIRCALGETNEGSDGGRRGRKHLL